jgi:hypothetical protein
VRSSFGKQGRKKPFNLELALSELNGQTIARLEFKSHHVVGRSLSDGNYRLIIHGNKIHEAEGRVLDGDGDGDVDLLDKKVFDKAYGKRASQSGYLWYLDANTNGRIWAEDLALFRLHYINCPRRC